MDRYNISEYLGCHLRNPEGSWVKYVDVKDMPERIAELETWYNRAMKDVRDLNRQIGQLKAERDALSASLARVQKTADSLLATGPVAGLIGQQIINDIAGKDLPSQIEDRRVK
jgi:hypothetical protein